MDLYDRPLFELDPNTDPVEEARRLHAQGPLIPVRLPGGVPAWAATDHATAQLVLGHEDLTKDPAYWPALADGRIPDDWELIAVIRGAAMLHQGGEDHRRLRRLAASAFSRAPVTALGSRIEEIVAELLDAVDRAGAEGPVDLREHFALLLPIRVICEVLGVPDGTVLDLRESFDVLVTSQDSASKEPVGDIRVAVADILGSLTALIADKRENPGDDLATALIQAREDGDRLSEQELIETVFLLLIAGHETTANLICNVVHAILRDPVATAAVRDAEGARPWGDIVDEGLRFSPPIRHALMRYALRDTSIAGVDIAKGEPVLACLFAVGRDTRQQQAPDTFDFTSPTRRDHLAFGYGAHYCLGARLAKLETEIALAALFTRYPNLALAGEPDPLVSIPLQGYRAMPVHLGSAQRVG
ncbi:cytochrome P450 family protein [Streptomyces sp. NPDC004838]